MIFIALLAIGAIRGVQIGVLMLVGAAGIASMGAPLAGLVMMPVGMQVARKYGVDYALMGLAICFATGEGSGSTISRGSASASTESGPFSFVQILTVVLMVSLIGSVLILAAFGKEPDIGLLCFLFGAILSLADPQTGRAALPKIDWSTVLLVAGIITFVGVLQTMGAVDLLGEGAEAIGSPLIEALGVCSAVIDVSPFSTLGATVVATAPGDHKARLTSILVKFGMSMVIIGPLVLVGGLVVPAMIF
ncbi:SLC13 family permease [Brevibacterium sp. CBA3109]|uniref:SLC13 family permease n=1 Tax=Brevibacterium koreense TaxID=3140787 RepID=A0AAU7UJ71_9MICO